MGGGSLRSRHNRSQFEGGDATVQVLSLDNRKSSAEGRQVDAADLVDSSTEGIGLSAQSSSLAADRGKVGLVLSDAAVEAGGVGLEGSEAAANSSAECFDGGLDFFDLHLEIVVLLLEVKDGGLVGANADLDAGDVGGVLDDLGGLRVEPVGENLVASLDGGDEGRKGGDLTGQLVNGALQLCDVILALLEGILVGVRSGMGVTVRRLARVVLRWLGSGAAELEDIGVFGDFGGGSDADNGGDNERAHGKIYIIALLFFVLI